jgi:multidrug efflux pump subunit AcrB
LRRYADFLRCKFQLVPNVKKVELLADQQEVAFLEISRRRLAELGIDEEQIYNQLQAKNVAADGGRVRVGDEHIAIDSTGGFRSAEDMLELVIDLIALAANSSLEMSRRWSAATRTRPAVCFGTMASPHWSRNIYGAGRQRREDG